MSRSCSSWWRASSRGVCLALALALGCGGGAPRAPRPGTLSGRARPARAATDPSPCAALHLADAPRVCAIATLDPDAGAIDVHLVVDPEALPASAGDVALAFRESLGADYAATRVEGEGPWPRALGRVDAPVELRYRVRLDGAPARGASWARPGGFHVTGRSLLPDVLVDGAPADVPATLYLDAGETPVFSAAGPDERVFDADRIARLADEAFELGPLQATRREVGGTTLWIATSGDESTGRLEEVADEVAHTMAALSAQLGAPTTDAALIAFHPSGAAEGFAERLGASVVFAAADEAPALPVDARFGLVRREGPHELGHLWIPGTHTVREAWIAEGTTDYLAVVALAGTDAAGRAARARIALRRHARYAADAAGRTLLTPADDATWVEDAGLLASFCLDAHLSESGSSLAAALRTTLAREEGEIGTEALLADLGAISGSAASHLEALAVTDRGFELDGCLEQLGFHVRRVSWDGWSDAAAGREVLGGVVEARGFDDAQGLEILEVDEGSSLEPGDVVLRVGEAEVGALVDVAFAVRELRAGEPLAIELRRAGEPRSLSRPMPALRAEATEERAHLELVAIDR